MPYKDPEQARAAKKRHYEKNKDLFKDRNRDRRSKVRIAIQEAKTDVPCADCGVIYPYWIMDFDHLPEHVKSFTISRQVGNNPNLELVLEEIAKCDVVCSNCHRQRSYDRLVGSTSRILDDGNCLENSRA